MGGGGSQTTTVVQSAEQRALQARQVELAEQQLELIRQQAEFQETAFEQFTPLLEAQQAEFERQAERARALEPIQDELLQRELENIRRGGAASPEQLAAIDEAIGASQERGEIDLERFQTEATQRLRNELAPSLGLRPTDTPIIDRGGQIAAEAIRQQGALTESLAGARANAALNFPLAASQVLSGQTQFQQGLAQATQQFQQQLRDAAFNNRLRLTGTQGGLGVSLANAASPISVPGGSTTFTETSGGSLGLGNILGGVGGLFTGLGGIGIGF